MQQHNIYGSLVWFIEPVISLSNQLTFHSLKNAKIQKEF